MIAKYGRVNGHGREAARSYQFEFPDRRKQNHPIIAAVYRPEYLINLIKAKYALTERIRTCVLPRQRKPLLDPTCVRPTRLQRMFYSCYFLNSYKIKMNNYLNCLDF